MDALSLRSSARPGFLELFSPLAPWRALAANRDLISQFTLRLFLARYRGTALGPLWALAFPLLMLAVFSFVFTVVFTARWGADPNESPSTYIVALFCGMMTFGVFSESTSRASTLVVENPNFVKKVVFPLEILPVASVGSSLLYSCFGLALVLLASAFFVSKISWTILLLPLTLLPIVLLSLGVGWFVAALGVYVRDVSNLVLILVQQVLFFMTPVLYRLDAIPERFRWIALANPLTYVVESVRAVMVFGHQPNWAHLALVSAVSLAVFQLGYAWFTLTRRGFADVL